LPLLSIQPPNEAPIGNEGEEEREISGKGKRKNTILQPVISSLSFPVPIADHALIKIIWGGREGYAREKKKKEKDQSVHINYGIGYFLRFIVSPEVQERKGGERKRGMSFSGGKKKKRIFSAPSRV